MTFSSIKLVVGLLVACLCSSLAGADTTGTTVGGYTFGSEIQGKQLAPALAARRRRMHAHAWPLLATHRRLCCPSTAGDAAALGRCACAQCPLRTAWIATHAGTGIAAICMRYQRSCRRHGSRRHPASFLLPATCLYPSLPCPKGS